ncbi:MAG: tetratricopeptide repeat protein [Rhodobacteraceae bacterium]|nr:tetratricopeptide repeat protein [Paracoccaceae bacterium]
MRRLAFATLALAASLTIPAPAHAVFSGDMSPRPPSGDADYAAGIAAWRDMEWAEMVGHLQKVVARRPWHDNAHTLLGYGYRRLGDYDRAFHHYDIALELNSRHRGALSYMGVAYLHLEDVEQAGATLDRLRDVCGFVSLTFSDGDFSDGCAEYHELKGAIDYYVETGIVIDICPDVGRPEA